MFIQKWYYILKPYLPWAVRMALRRQRANHVRATHADVWPIDEAAAAVPPGWPGWPDGKRFAVVLTHDVEGLTGYSRVERLMKLERAYGLRSSFNFVPEGGYRVSDATREMLGRAGFEVGIHGLHHDGKLYASRKIFAQRAARIREYANRWNAVGFRSPFMHHKLSWLHELEMEYDASTFDVDPFEPQNDAAGTIFPYWVAGNNGGGYVELPYTLVQDFSLFTILQERGIDFWKKKVDWLAQKGGMVLLNTHPDYMCFEGQPNRDEYPVEHYEELLRYITEKYAGSYWSGVPREVARNYRVTVPVELRNTRKKVCMIAYSNYECDNRVRRYAETLTARGDYVEAIAVAGGDTPLGDEVIKGVTVHRIQSRRYREASKCSYIWKIFRFLISSSRFVARNHQHKKYDVIHVHNMPDFLVFSAWFPKWAGAKVILDIHDIVPELFVSKFRKGLTARWVTMLKVTERISAAFADHVIVANHLWYEKLISRSVARAKCSVVLNHVDRSIFSPQPRTRNDGKFIVVFPGSFQWHQGLDLAIEAVGRIRNRVPNLEFHIYGGGPEAPALMELSKELGLADVVQFRGGVSLDQVPAVIANADLGVVPKRANSFGNEACSTKIMEFMSQGVPVVVSRTKIDTYYYDEKTVRFFNSGDIDALAEAMLDVIEHPDVRESLIAAGYRYIERNGWEAKRREYLALIDSLTVESFEASRAAKPVAAISGQPTL